MTNLTYHCSNVVDLSSHYYKLCYDNNMGSRGYMRSVLTDCRDKTSDWYGEITTGKAILLWENDTFVGWALLFQQSIHKRRGEVEAHFYIKPGHRCRGYGTQLHKLILKYSQGKTIRCKAWDTSSDAFFSKVSKRAKRYHVVDKGRYY